MNLIYLAFAWLLGILLSAWTQPSVLDLLCLLVLPPAIILPWWRERRIRWWGVYLLFALLGAWRLTAAQPHIDARHIAYYNDQGTVTIQGVIVADPDLRDTYANLRVRAQSLADGEGRREVRGDILVNAPRYPYRSYGDVLEIRGRLQTPPVLADFSYKEYLARQGIYSLMSYPQIAALSRGKGNPFYLLLFAFRRRARETIASLLPEPEASLLTGILTGVESSIPEETLEAFTRTGTVHIIVISGFNLTLLAGLLVRLGTRIINKRYALVLAFAGIICYTLFVGAGAPVVRAAIMFSVSLLAYWVGRPYAVDHALAVAVMAMTAINPRLPWDVSFQLSLAATLGLVMLAPLLENGLRQRLMRRLPEEKAIKLAGLVGELFIASLAAQLATMPVILYHFGRLSVISLLTNALILPVQPYVMIFGGLTTLAGLVLPPLARILAWTPWLLMTYTVRVVEWTAQPAWASVSVQMTSWLVASYYVMLFGGCWLLEQAKQARAQLVNIGKSLVGHMPTALALGGLAVAATLLWIAVFSLPDGRLHVHFLDVGQGDAIFIQLPEGQQVLIDGGPEPSRLLAALGRVMPFWDRRLDLVVLTHPDMDHLGGLIPVLERYQVDTILDTEFLKANPPGEQWRTLAASRGSTVVKAKRGLRFAWGDGLWIDALHPGPQPLTNTHADDNNNSVVLRLAYGQVSFLFTGDIEAEAEAALLSSGQLLPSQVLKVSHHGAQEASTASFLQKISPQLAVISVGKENRHGHPAGATLKRLQACGARILRTDQQGNIEVITDGQQLQVRTSR